MLLQFANRRTHLFGCIGVELLQADIAHLGAIGTGVELTVDGMNFNARPHKGDVDDGALAAQAQHHVASFRSTNKLHRIFRGHPLSELTINRNDDVFGLDPCF